MDFEYFSQLPPQQPQELLPFHHLCLNTSYTDPITSEMSFSLESQATYINIYND